MFQTSTNEGNSSEQVNESSYGRTALFIGGSVAVGLVGLIALPVAVGFYGFSGGFSSA